MSRLKDAAGAALAALLIAGGAAAQGAAPSPVADHHMHIISPESARILKISCARLGPIRCPPEISTGSSTGADAVAALDHAGIGKGVLLSTGYFFGSPELADLGLDVAKEMRAENAFVVAQARASCGRLAAFVSVDPLRPGAVEEIDYWGRAGGASGVKLHLGNSGVDLRDSAQAAKVAAVFRAAARYHLPIVIHLATRRADYGAPDARIFLRDVLPAAGGVPVQIAHAGGGGGVTAGTLSALTAFAEAIRRDPAGTANLSFDLAMVPDGVSNTAVRPASPGRLAALEVLMRRIGLRRFVLASDWTKPLDLARYYRIEKAALGLPEPQWAALAANTEPWMRQRLAGSAACRPHSRSRGGG
jgi:hypothetical protein